VLSAYEHHCAICDLQLNLLEAAHIIPVDSPGSNDLTSNGMSLCHLHHEAYDRGLVIVDEQYRVFINQRRIKSLKQEGHLHGLDQFTKMLRPEIRLPDAAANRPRPEYLRRGMELRVEARH
jgi:putative restriction endonuclease